MRRFSLLLLAASSLACIAAKAETRPHYGGTLRIGIREAPQSIAPANMTGPSLASLSRQIFETLVKLDPYGHPQPLLATSWQPEPGNQRWRFQLRSGVSFHDGTPLDATSVVASLRNSEPGWKVVAAGDAVIIETDNPSPELPAELALARNAIVHFSGSQLNGTGAFVGKLDPGRHLTLIANDQYWDSRPFLDNIEVDFGVNDRDGTVALDLAKTDAVQIAPENIQRLRSRNRNVVTSDPDELVALILAKEPSSEMDRHVRSILAQSLDKTAIADVVLQGGGEASSALLPNWLSGYAFLFNPGAEPPQRTEAYLHPLTLASDANDAIARVIAERVLLNARDAGLTLQLAASSNADMRLVRLPLASSNPYLSLMETARALDLPVPSFTAESVESLYTAEQALLQTRRVIPLVHVRNAFVLRPSVRGWSMFPDGTWNLSNVWLAPERP